MKTPGLVLLPRVWRESWALCCPGHTHYQKWLGPIIPGVPSPGGFRKMFCTLWGSRESKLVRLDRVSVLGTEYGETEFAHIDQAEHPPGCI